MNKSELKKKIDKAIGKTTDSRLDDLITEVNSLNKNLITFIKHKYRGVMGESVNVKVENYPDQKEEFKVTNLDEIKIPEPKGEVKVTNLDDIKIPEQKSEVKVSNLSDIKIPKPPKEIEVKQPSWYKQLNPLSVTKPTIDAIERAIVKTFNVKLVGPRDAKRPISVILSNGQQHYVASTGGGGGGGFPDSILITEVNRAFIADTTSTANVIYIGYAAIGSATASAVWQIQEWDVTSGLVVTWADGDDSFNNIWDNRVGLSYS